jgi:predicted nucleotide-binding protein
MSKMSVFVGSSSQGIEVARAMQAQLSDESTEVELWNEAVFPLGFGTLESLVQALNRFDFAVLIMTPDEPIMVHGIQKLSARDNVLIELGIYRAAWQRQDLSGMQRGRELQSSHGPLGNNLCHVYQTG